MWICIAINQRHIFPVNVQYVNRKGWTYHANVIMCPFTANGQLHLKSMLGLNIGQRVIGFDNVPLTTVYVFCKGEA